MNERWKMTLTSVMLGTAIIMQGGAALPAAALAAEPSATEAGENAAAEPAATEAAAETPADNHLTENIQAAVKGASVESTPDGLRIAVTVRLYNGGTEKQRVPDYELRVQTADGLDYTLDASSDNKKALKPKEIGELVYMSVVDSKAAMKLAGVSFVKVDEYAYPKTETTLLGFPLGSEVWYGSSGSALPTTQLAWGQTFSIPGLNSDLLYTPAGLTTENTDKGPVAVVTLLTQNPGLGRETVPDFRLDVRAGQKTFAGARTEKDDVTVEAGEQKYIHFAVPMENNAEPSSLILMTTDTFLPGSGSGSSQTSGGQAAAGTQIDTGRLAVTLPAGAQADPASTASYTLGSPIAVDPLSKLIDHTQVTLMELHMQQNPGEGYKTAIGKFVLTNKSDKPVPTPAFETELVGGGGAAYSGVRQTNVAATLNPGLSYVVSYSFNIPQTESGDGLVLKLLDGQTASPYKIAIASVQAPLQKESDDNTLHLYPYDIHLTDWTVGTNYGTTTASYSYKMKLTLDMKQAENVVVDQNFSKLHFEVVDKLGRVLGTADGSFTGSQKLVSGTQTIVTNSIASEQFEFPITVNMYEVIETPDGQAKRLLKTLS
ncbi:Telomeric repeat-binding factor 2 [Paenibacillus konkukensis]|uniref:Telomeric repeat-binding factor 2 n=1 Tax=Paenibacillus konkukensis TaxID=2020716 RepID=A0ABY4RQB4_9BACL|nr:hypothetical protein [Paenibacillus konkukensis]UQZ83557.1 Telomeric repeat-binding factor 2 [Paenibacillus konkukensis]